MGANIKGSMKYVLKIIFVGILVLTISKVAILLNNVKLQKTVLEPYCAARYAHSVEDYKACKSLSVDNLLKKLTQEQINKNHLNLPILPPLK